MTVEIFRPAVGYEGRYKVSNHGRVASLARVNAAGRLQKGRVLKAGIDRYGRPVVSLCTEGKMTTHVVSHLVAEAFIGPRPDGLQVLHWDDVKTHNHVSNLRYGTQKENMEDMLRNGTNRYGEKHPDAKLTEADVLAIRASAEVQSRLAEQYGVSKANISAIKIGRSWKHLKEHSHG